MKNKLYRQEKFKFRRWLFILAIVFIVDATLNSLKAQVSPLCVAQTPTEAIQNGGFEDGLGAPATFGPHSLFIGGPGQYSGSGQYYIGKSPKYFNIGFPNDFLPHTGDNMLMVDAAVLANSVCWQQTVTIIPNRLYFFSAWLRSLSNGERCQLQFQISTNNGLSWTALGPAQMAPLPDDPWLQIYESWHSGNNTTAILRLSNFNPGGFGYGGNDFAIDDISFKDLCLDPTLGAKPVMSADISLCGKPSVEIPTHIPDQNDIKFTWYKDGVLINNSDVPTLTGVTELGTYTVCVDSNTCLQSGTINIVSTLTINLGPDATLCNPATKVLNTGIDPSLAGGFDIKWYRNGTHQAVYDGMISITVDAPGTYRVEAVDNNTSGCNASDEIIISSNLPIPNHVEFCGPNQTVNLSVTGSSTYRWYNSPTGGLSLHTGNTYTVTPPVNGATYYVVDASNPTCQRVAVMARVAPNCCYALTGTTLVPSIAGDICSGTPFNLTYSGGQAGDSLMLQRTADPISGTWTNVSAVQLNDPYVFNGLSISETTTYRVVTFSNGAWGSAACQNNSSTTTINLAVSPVAGTASINQTAICEGESFTLTLTGSTGTIQWQRSINGGAFADISGASGVTYTDNPTVNQSPVQYRAVVSRAVCPNVISNVVSGEIDIATRGNNLIPSVTSVCSGSSFTITYSGGQSGDSLMLQKRVGASGWTNVQAVQLSDPFTFTNLSIIATTDYRVVTFSNGAFATAHCTDNSSEVTVNLAVSPIAGTASISPGTICTGESVTLSLTGSAGNIQWQRAYGGGTFENIFGATTANYTDSPTQTPVQYKAIVGGGTSCPNVTSNTVSAVVSEVAGGTITGTSEVCDGEPATLSLNGFKGSIQWQDSLPGGIWKNIPGQTTSGISYSPSNIITTDFIRVIVTDPTGSCNPVSSNTFIVVSDTCPSARPVFLPNALTPNGDGSNDVFYIGNIELYPDNHLTIFNRWGSIVYESYGYDNEWDGNDLPVATYYFVLELGKDKNGNSNPKNTYKGTVTLIR